MITRLKSLTDRRLAGVGRRLYHLGLTPNRLSLLGLLFTAVAARVLLLKWLLTPVVFMILAGAADALDGIVARASNTASKRGGFLDTLTDRYSDILLFGALLFCGWLEPLGWDNDPLPYLGEIEGEVWALGALTGALLTSFARASAERLGISQEGVGLVERPERLGILALGLLAGLLMTEIVTWTLALLTVLGHVTVLQRAAHFWRQAPPGRAEGSVPAPEPAPEPESKPKPGFEPGREIKIQRRSGGEDRP